MIPVSASQCSLSHTFASVFEVYHVSRLQPSVQSSVKKPFSATFKRGFRPMQQCNMIVKHSAAIEKREAAVNWERC